jgi:hypothetical protein
VLSSGPIGRVFLQTAGAGGDGQDEQRNPFRRNNHSVVFIDRDIPCA